MKGKYHINLFWSDESRWNAATHSRIRSCSALGDTPEAALRELEVAVEAWLATAKQKKMPIPKPRYRPAIYAAE